MYEGNEVRNAKGSINEVEAWHEARLRRPEGSPRAMSLRPFCRKRLMNMGHMWHQYFA